MKWAVFLDRDGTIVVDKHYLSDPDEFELLPNALAGLRELRNLGALLAEGGVELDGIYVCPHAPDEGCDCRRPRTALFEQAAEELGLELGESFIVGDKEADVEAGRRIGATPILIGGDAPDLLAAVRLVRSAGS